MEELSMDEYGHLARLTQINDMIGELEERHNEILDRTTTMNKQTDTFTQELSEEADTCTKNLSELRKDIIHRRDLVKKVTVILSLLGQEEELAPIRSRVDRQPYESYVTSRWFKSQL